MRIAVAVHGYPPAAQGGVERVASEQAEALVARGHEVFVFTRDARADGLEGEARDETVRGVRVRRVAAADGARSPFSEYYEGRLFDDAFRAFLTAARPDVLHVQHLVTLSLRLIDLAQEAGVPVVVSLHDAFYVCHRLFLLDAAGERCPGPDAGLRCVRCLAEHGVGDAVRARFDAMARRLASADAVTAPSPSLAARYEVELPFLRDRIRIVEPGLSRVPSAVARDADAGDRPLRLLFVGTLAPHKGLDVLVDALERLPAEDYELTIYGEAATAGAWLDGLRSRTANRRVRWAGSFADEERDDVFARSDVVVVPSRCDESWSRVVREARAVGRAVVATDAGGPADWLRHGVDALLVEPGSTAGVAAAVSRLRADPELLERLSTPAGDVPTVDEAAARLEGIFAEATARRAATPTSRGVRVTVAYVTKNGAEWLDESVAAVRAQRGRFELVEVLAIDSGSRDGTLDVLARHGVRVVEIDPREFGHGRTRNLAAREARGDVVAFLTQDAAPANPEWLDRLVRALEDDPLCAAAWSLHVPRPDCHPMEWRMLAEHPPFRPDREAVQTARGNPGYAADPEAEHGLSNNSAAYRRDVLLRWPFPDVTFAEDRAWARDVLEAGWRTVLVRDSVVRHSHSYSPWVNLRRNFDHWRAMAEELGDRDDFGLAAGWRASFREARRDVAFWAEHTGRPASEVARRWAIPAALYHLGAFTGRWLGSRARWMPRGLPDRLSMHTLPDPRGSRS